MLCTIATLMLRRGREHGRREIFLRVRNGSYQPDGVSKGGHPPLAAGGYSILKQFQTESALALSASPGKGLDMPLALEIMIPNDVREFL